MDRKAYLWALEQALTGLVPARERAEMIRYYEEYFDEAGPEGEAAVIDSLGDPRVLAEKLAAEAGFAAPLSQPVQAKKRNRILIAVWAILVGLVLLAVGATILGVAIFGANFNDPNVRVTEEPMSRPALPSGQIGESISGETFTAVDVEAAVADVTVQVGEEYSVSVSWDSDGTYSLNYTFSDGVLKVTSAPKAVSGFDIDHAAVLITVPKGAVLTEIDIEVGLGDIILTNISAKDVSCDTGLGDMIWTGPLAREVELNTGMGDLSILTDSVDGWEVELAAGLGLITVNGKDRGSSYQKLGVSGELSANTGMGNITLTYEE